MSSMASAGWCIEHLFQQNNDNLSRLETYSRPFACPSDEELLYSKYLPRSLFQ